MVRTRRSGRRIAPAAAALLLAGTLPLQAQQRPTPAPTPGALPKLSDIDRCTVTFGATKPLAEGVQEYSGYVDLDCGTFRIQADRIVQDRNVKTAKADGNVSLSWQGNRLAGSSLLFHLDTETGEILDARGVFPPDATVTAERMEKVSDDVVLIRNGIFSSCTQPVPYWAFRIRRGRFHLEHYAHLHGVTMTAGHVPVFYTPWLIWPIKGDRATGLLFPEWGSSTYLGFYIGDQFFWPFADNADLTVQGDWYQRSGVGGGVELNWLPDSRGKVEFDGYALNDRQAGQFRHIGSLKAIQPFGRGWKFGMDLEEVSDFRYYTDFARTLVVASTPATISTARLGRDWSYYSFAVRLEDRRQYYVQSFVGPRTLNEQVDQRSLPEVELRGGSRRLWGSPFYFAFQTRGDWLDRRDHAFFTDLDFDGTLGGEFRAAYGRADAAGRLSLPLVPAPWLDLEIATDLRETWWGASEEPIVRDADGTLRSGGLRPAGSLRRDFGQLSVEATGPKFFRTWESGSGRRWKHVLEPRLLWQFAPQADYREPLLDAKGNERRDPVTGQPILSSAIPFDEIEQLNNAFQRIDLVTYGVRQRLLVKPKAAPPSSAAVAVPVHTAEAGVAAPPWGPGSLAPAIVVPAQPAPPEVYPAPETEGPGAAGGGEPLMTPATGPSESAGASSAPLYTAVPAAGETVTAAAATPWPAAATATPAWGLTGMANASAARPGGGGTPVEVASLEVTQSWSLGDPFLAQPEFGTRRTVDPITGAVTTRTVLLPQRSSPRGPISITGRVNPSLNVSVDLRADYDVLQNRFSTESLSASFRTGSIGYSNIAWVRTVTGGTTGTSTSAVTASGGVALFDRRLTTDLRFSWDGASSRFVDQGVRVGYYTQCCGFLSEWGRRDFLGNQRNEIRFLIDLKGIGKFLDLKTGTAP